MCSSENNVFKQLKFLDLMENEELKAKVAAHVLMEKVKAEVADASMEKVEEEAVAEEWEEAEAVDVVVSNVFLLHKTNFKYFIPTSILNNFALTH